MQKCPKWINKVFGVLPPDNCTANNSWLLLNMYWLLSVKTLNIKLRAGPTAAPKESQGFLALPCTHHTLGGDECSQGASPWGAGGAERQTDLLSSHRRSVHLDQHRLRLLCALVLHHAKSSHGAALILSKLNEKINPRERIQDNIIYCCGTAQILNHQQTHQDQKHEKKIKVSFVSQFFLLPFLCFKVCRRNIQSEKSRRTPE